MTNHDAKRLVVASMVRNQLDQGAGLTVSGKVEPGTHLAIVLPDNERLSAVVKEATEAVLVIECVDKTFPMRPWQRGDDELPISGADDESRWTVL